MLDNARNITDVAIVGYGPVGETAAALLGLYGVQTAVFERETAPRDLPRASTTDDEVMRIFAIPGLADRLLQEMTPTKGVRWVSGAGEVLGEIPMEGSGVSVYGYPAQIFFWQPRLEAVLREAGAGFAPVTVHLGHEVMGLQHDADGVTLTVRDLASGETREVRAQYLLACDGGRSTICHLAGIHHTGSTSEHPWLVVDAAVKAPLPHLTYLQLDCNPTRPAVSYPMPLGHHRWEFMVMPGESEEQMERAETVDRLLTPYVDPKEVTVLRKAVYKFHQRVAERWRDGRVLLLGDAAHLMPPFLGQGMAAGIRDAGNLCWKLSMVLRGTADTRILDTYEAERRPHVEAMIEVSARNGSVIQTVRPSIAHLRDSVFKTLNRIPRAKEYLSHMDFKPVPVYKAGLLAQNAAGEQHPAAGALFIQPVVETAAGQRTLLDSVLGTRFAVVAIGVTPPTGLSARSRAFWGSLPTRFVQVQTPGAPVAAAPGWEQVTDVEGKLAAWAEEHHGRLVVLRPDRFVFGLFAAGGLAGAEDKLRSLQIGP